MGNYNKWNRDEVDNNIETPINVVLFVSRNKDNKDVEDFKERRNAFVTTRNYNDFRLIEDFHAFVLSAAIQRNGKVMYIPVASHTYLDKDIAEKVAAQIKDVYEKLKFAKIYKKLVFMHPLSHRYMTILDVDSKSIKEKVKTWQKQYTYEEIPFKMFFVNDYGEVYRYEELLDEFIEYQKALELKDKLEIDF